MDCYNIITTYNNLLSHYIGPNNILNSIETVGFPTHSLNPGVFWLVINWGSFHGMPTDMTLLAELGTP